MTKRNDNSMIHSNVVASGLVAIALVLVGFLGGYYWDKSDDECPECPTPDADRNRSELVELHGRLDAVESPDARPCIICVLDRSDTPYCRALCGPTPTESLHELFVEWAAQLGEGDGFP